MTSGTITVTQLASMRRRRREALRRAGRESEPAELLRVADVVRLTGWSLHELWARVEGGELVMHRWGPHDEYLGFPEDALRELLRGEH